MTEVKNCPYCNEDNKRIVGVQNHKDKYLSLVDERLNDIERVWFKCDSCRFVFRSPAITEEEATIIYSKYRTYEFRKITPEDYFNKIISLPLEESDSYKKALFVKSNIQSKVSSILDIGCGAGFLLYHLKKLFPETKMMGLEPNTDYSSMVRKKLNIEVVEDYYKVGSINDSFDLTVSTNVLEHIHDLRIFWEAAYTNIKQNKYLFIEVPSQNDFKLLDMDHDVFATPHLYFFGMEHIVDIAKEFNFKLISYKFNLENDRGMGKEWFIFVKE